MTAVTLADNLRLSNALRRSCPPAPAVVEGQHGGMSPAPSAPASDSPLPPIGMVRSAYGRTEETPVQARLNPDADGVVEMDPAYAAGLADLSGFDFA